MSITQSVTLQPDTPALSQEHERILTEGSGISPDVIAERGVRTITRGRELPPEFSRRQRRRGGGILFTVHRPSGETCHVFRPDQPDPKNPGHKYELPPKVYGGPGNVLDIHPSTRHLIADTSVPVIFVEGIKKADATTSSARAAGINVLPVAISGVWNWLSDGEPIPDMGDIPLKGRKAIIGFDSDMIRNPDVQDAAHRLAGHLISRGAEVWIAYLHDQPDGSKTGLDDFFARSPGGTIAELRLLLRRYNPEDFAAVRLSRDERLRLMIEDLERTFWGFTWKGMGGHSARDVYLKLIEAAKRYGVAVDDGIRVRKAQGPLAIEAKVSTRTLWKAVNRLEESGLVYRDNEGRKPDRSGAFVLRANVSQDGTERGGEGTQALPANVLYAGDLHLRAPRLRWSRPRFTPRRGAVRDTRRVRQGVKPQPRDPIKRLGKIRGAMLDALDDAGGSATLQEIAATLHRARPRDLRRRNLPMLEDARIIVVEGDVLTLAEDWLERVKEQRQLGKEIEAEELDYVRYEKKSRAFHNREHVKPDPHWTNVAADGAIEDLNPADEPVPPDLAPTPLSPLAKAIRNYLDTNPKDADQPAGWLGATLWAHELFPGKPTPEEVKVAVEELGGDEYRRRLLGKSRSAA
jgi:hypothetical protein